MQKLNCILLVDDDDITNFVHESLLEEADVTEEILVAKNGQEALNLLTQRFEESKEYPALIFLDINMPVMNGFEFLEKYQRLDESIKQSVHIVVLTTSLNIRDIERTRDTGIADFLNKPLTYEKLRGALEKHFGD